MENSFARSAGSCGEFPVYQKWGQDLALDITCAVTISERLLPQEKTEGHPGFLPMRDTCFGLDTHLKNYTT